MPGPRTLALLSLLLAAIERALDVEGPLPPGGWALGGLAGCAAIVVVAKWLGSRWLQRPEDDA